MNWTESTSNFACRSDELELMAQKDELQNGLQVKAGNQTWLDLFGLRQPGLQEQPDSAYSRLGDLIGLFQFGDYHVEHYWRAQTEPSGFSVESNLSLRSDLLRLTPIQFELASRSRSDASIEVMESAEGTCLFDSDSNRSALFLVYRSDSQDVTTEHRGHEIVHRVHLGAMERGVIRRIRIRCCLFSGKPTERQIEIARDGFETSKIPLTT